MAFKSEGSAYVGAETVLPFKQCLAWYLQNNAALDEDDRALLKRWLHDDRASEAWSAIQAHSEKHVGPIGVDAPIYFIVFILEVKNAAEYESAALSIWSWSPAAPLLSRWFGQTVGSWVSGCG